MCFYFRTSVTKYSNAAAYKFRDGRKHFYASLSRHQLIMSLQIISVLPALEEATRCLQDDSLRGCCELLTISHAIPPASPLPVSGFSTKPASTSQDTDSGCGSLGKDSYFDDLPGSNVTDREFRESFAVSAASSRRSSSSHGLAILLNVEEDVAVSQRIPEPPPPPPIQFFIPRIDPVILEPELEITPQRPEPNFPVRAFRRYLSDDSDIYGSLQRINAAGRDENSGLFPTSAGTCIVCYDSGDAFLKLRCCDEIVCSTCLATTITTRLSDGLIEFPCPNPECSDPIGRPEVLRHLTAEEKERYERLRVNAESDGTRKTCPHCSHITELHLPRRGRFRKRPFREEEVKIVCENCRIEWCFQCHAPWHRDMACKVFIRGNKMFQTWTKDRPNGVANCQKCPTCRVFIQRSTGCDHMTCNRCRTHFCYKCGGRFIDIPGLGDHYGNMSIFGCKYNYLPSEPIKRRALRGGYFGAKIAGLTGYPVLFVGGVAVLVVVGAVALPIYGGYRLYKFKKNTSRTRRRWRRRH